MSLLFWTSPSIFLLRFCSIISAQCVRRFLQSTEEPSDSWETECCETSCAEVHFLPKVNEAWGESWKMTDNWKRSDFSSRPSQKPWLPLHDEPGLPHLSFLWGGIAASRQIMKSHRIMCHNWPVWTSFLYSKLELNPSRCFCLCETEKWRTRKGKSQPCSFSPYISISLQHILFASFSPLAVTVSLHVGRGC